MFDAVAEASQHDLSLIQAVGRGEERAVETFYRTHCDALLRFVSRRMPDQFEDAQEVTHDTFLHALRLAPSYRGESSAYSWLCGIARLRIIDFHRKQNRERRIPRGKVLSLDEAGEVQGVRSGPLDALYGIDQLLRGLSEDEREALMLRYVDEFTVREIAAVMKRTEKGIENLLARAKDKQRKALALIREGVDRAVREAPR